MLKLKEAVIVEGKYDKIKLSSVIDAVIIPTNGFNIFKNRETLEIIRYFAAKTGIIILTDSDAAGFKIRSYIKGAVKDGKITNVYISYNCYIIVYIRVLYFQGCITIAYAFSIIKISIFGQILKNF